MVQSFPQSASADVASNDITVKSVLTASTSYLAFGFVEHGQSLTLIRTIVFHICSGLACV